MTTSALKEADDPGRGGVDRHPGRGGVDLGGHARWQLKSLEEMYVPNYRQSAISIVILQGDHSGLVPGLG